MNDINDAVRYLSQSLEHEMFHVKTRPEEALRRFLSKLDIKSAKFIWSGAIQIESLEAVLRNVKFDAKHLKST